MKVEMSFFEVSICYLSEESDNISVWLAIILSKELTAIVAIAFAKALSDETVE